MKELSIVKVDLFRKVLNNHFASMNSKLYIGSSEVIKRSRPTVLDLRFKDISELFEAYQATAAKVESAEYSKQVSDASANFAYRSQAAAEAELKRLLVVLRTVREEQSGITAAYIDEVLSSFTEGESTGTNDR